MLGAIVGDIVGSQFEHTNYLSKSFELFSPECSFSDDTVLTLAVCQALLETETKPELLPPKGILPTLPTAIGSSVTADNSTAGAYRNSKRRTSAVETVRLCA